jgi:TonB family protein
MRRAAPDGRVLDAAFPRLPAAAQTQAITGIVYVAIVLAADGGVADTNIILTPSQLLDASALQAARATKYAPAVLRCAPVPAAYVFAVGYGMR